VRVRLDDGRCFTVPEAVWRELQVQAPGPLPPDAERQLERQNLLRRLRRRALGLVAVRPRSKWELASRLAKAAAPELVAQVVADLEAQGLVDDARFAREWVQARRTSRGLGAARLRYELLKRGICPELVHSALQEAAEEEEVLAVDVARRRLPRYARQPPAAASRRLAAYLARRGFGPATVLRALKAVGLHPAGSSGTEGEL